MDPTAGGASFIETTVTLLSTCTPPLLAVLILIPMGIPAHLGSERPLDLPPQQPPDGGAVVHGPAGRAEAWPRSFPTASASGDLNWAWLQKTRRDRARLVLLVVETKNNSGRMFFYFFINECCGSSFSSQIKMVGRVVVSVECQGPCPSGNLSVKKRENLTLCSCLSLSFYISLSWS